MNMCYAIRLQPAAALWRYCDMPYGPSERSVSSERALLQALGASLRGASFKALIVRNKRRPPAIIVARPMPEGDVARELLTIAPAAVTEVD